MMPGEKPPIPREGYPVEMGRNALVQLVRDVLGEVRAVESAGQYGELGLWGQAQSVRLAFMLEGRESLGEFLVPIPPGVLAVMADAQRNPYGRVSVRCSVDLGAPAPEASPAETGAAV